MTITAEEYRAKQTTAAADAMARGQAAFAADDLAAADRWLDRARRIAGGNDAIELLLATVRLRRGDASAAAMFSALAERHDLREAWLGLASAKHRAGRWQEAADALDRALSGHAGTLPGQLPGLADAIARDAGAAGWCCLTNAGEVAVSPAGLEVRLELDGVAVARLPDPAATGATLLAVLSQRGRVLGGPLRLAAMRRLEAFVAAEDGGLQGFAWHPNDPSRIPVLRVIGAARTVAVRPDTAGAATGSAERHDRPLARRRSFRLAAAELPGDGPLRVVDGAGADITGSPADPGAYRRYVAAVAGALAPSAAAITDALRWAPVAARFVGTHRAPGAPAREVAVVVPVYRGVAATLACLDSVFANTPADVAVIVVDDCGPDCELGLALDAMALAGRIRLIRHDRNRGFPAAANTGLRIAAAADVVLLNADTLVPPGWLAGLRKAAHAAPDIASATPFSNDATLLSYPKQAGDNPAPGQAAVDRLARLAERANGGVVIDIPTAVGFCMYVRRDAVEQVGGLREDVFAQGYGEENDWCLRARHLGWRHVAAPGMFVGHVGGVSFGAARSQLLRRNLAILNRLHPGYDALIAADEAGPALALARRRLDLAVLAARRRPAGEAVVLITHDLGGGVQRQVEARGAALRGAGLRPIFIKPVLARPLLQGTGECTVEIDPALPNLVYRVDAELPALARLLARQRVRAVEVHHMLGHDHGLMALPAALGVPYEVHVHDYAWFCPRVSLLGFERRYCGEPDIAGCEHCIADAGRNIDDEIPVAALVARSAADLAGAERVIAPSQDVADRCARHFPGLRPEVRPWDDSRPPARLPALPRPSLHRPRIVGVLGAIGVEKGFDVLLACARDVVARRMPLRFVVLGHSTDDARLLDTGAVFVTGEYRAEDLPGLIATEGVQMAFLPSVWPETWCFTLSEAWRAGLGVVAFDIGAPAERIRRHGGGMLVPLGCRPAQVNDMLMK